MDILPALEMGTILANLNYCGKIPAGRDLFKRMVKIGDMIYPTVLITLFGILSVWQDLFLRLLIICEIESAKTGLKKDFR